MSWKVGKLESGELESWKVGKGKGEICGLPLENESPWLNSDKLGSRSGVGIGMDL